jgi:hypothetical protein
MEPLDFLAAVLPSPGHGYYCAAELSSNKKAHVFVSSLEEIAPYTTAWLDSKRDIYFALSTFADKGKRTADNAEYVRSLFIDMDGYESKKAAANALSAFLETTGLDSLGLPWIVGSGGGLHCYWALEDAVPVAQWKPIAELLKRVCKQFALAIDNTVTADAARVLRIPGTVNFKPKYPEPRPVRLLTQGSVISFSAMSAKLRELAEEDEPVPEVAPIDTLPGTRPINATTNGVQLMANTVSKFKNIMLRTKDGDGCQQLAYYVEHAAEEGMEPLWRAWLSQAKYCADAERAAPWLSNLHPYDASRMQEKLIAIKGPYSCVKIEGLNPGGCAGCKHRGSITNPLGLGRELVADNAPKEVEIIPHDPEDPEAPAIKVFRPSPPKGYAYGVNGGVFCDRIVEEADGTKRKQQIMILPYDLFVADLLHKDGEYTVHLIANRPGNSVDILLPQRYAVSKDELLKTLAQQNIIAAFGAGNDKNLYEFVRACVEEASTNKQAIKIPAQYGWQEDGSFVYSGRVFFPDGSTRTVPMPDLANLTRVTRPMGTLEEWRRFPELLIKRGLHELLGISAIGFGAPLMRFSQMNALTFHAGSTDSGTGKSLALSLLNSIWGHPIRYRTGKSTSPVTMQQRIGNLNSLPFTSDEITHKQRHDMEWFPGMVFDLSEGQGKEKSETHHNRERINLVSWATLALFTSNTNMHDYMSGVRSHTSQGELLRMLEWTPSTKLNWTQEEEEVLRLLSSNHGVAGEKYVRWLVQNEETARKIWHQTYQHLKAKWQMSGDERFWAAGCASVVAGCILASSNYADVVDYPIDAVMSFLHSLIRKARKVVKTGARTCEDVLNAFTRDNYGSFVVIKRSNGNLLAELGNGEQIDRSITRSKVMGRVEHEIERLGHIEFFLEEQVIKSHCVAMSFGYEDFKRQLAAQPTYTVKFMRKDMMSKTNGPQMRVRALSILRPLNANDELPLVDSD